MGHTMGPGVLVGVPAERAIRAGTMRALALLTLCLGLGCGAITPLKPDGGQAGGAAGGLVSGGGQGGGLVAGGAAGGSAGGVGGGDAGGSAGGMGGGAAGGAAGGSAGGQADAGLGAFVWSNLGALPPPSSFTGAVTVAARAGEAWVGMDNGKLYRSTGMAFNEVVGFSLSGLSDLYVSPSGKVYAVSSGRTAAHCLAADCSAAANFTTVMSATGSTTEVFRGVCGAGERVVAYGSRDSMVGVLYEFDGMGAWTKVSNNLGISTTQDCAIGPGGEVYVVGDLGVVRYENGATTPETIDLMGQPNAAWTGIALAVRTGAIVEAMIVGSGSGYRFARRNQPTMSWTSLAPNTAGSALYTVVSLGPTEFLAAGSGSGTGRFMAWNGTSWAPAVPAPPNTISTVRDAWATDAREVFLVGSDGASSYTIIRGRR